MKAGLTSVTFRKKSAEEIVKFAAKCGLECIEWGADVHARPDDLSAIANIVKLCKEYGVEPVSYGSYYKAGCDNEFSAMQVVDAAARLEAKRIRVWAGCKSAALVSESEFDAMAADLQSFVALAAKQNITVATEFHHHSYTEYARDALKLLRAVPGLRTYWQENPQITVLENYGELKMLLSHVETVHAFYFDKELNRYPLSEAKERWLGYVDIVREKDKSDIPFLLEFVKGDSFEQAEKDARQLCELLEEKCI